MRFFGADPDRYNNVRTQVKVEANNSPLKLTYPTTTNYVSSTTHYESSISIAPMFGPFFGAMGTF
ncbi:MAG: hypothetical protein JW841_03175 [Deltaproteobacteria bacterium]|nr:hypothetical protein [Deltaproteobacteria bacterium]